MADRDDFASHSGSFPTAVMSNQGPPNFSSLINSRTVNNGGETTDTNDGTLQTTQAAIATPTQAASSAVKSSGQADSNVTPASTAAISGTAVLGASETSKASGGYSGTEGTNGVTYTSAGEVGGSGGSATASRNGNGSGSGVSVRTTSVLVSGSPGSYYSPTTITATGNVPTTLQTSATGLPTSSNGSTPAALTRENQCNSVTCNPGLAAAIFAPIGVLAISIPLCIFAFIYYRRRKRSNAGYRHGRTESLPSNDGEIAQRPSPEPSSAFLGMEALGALTFNPPSTSHSHDRDFGAGFVAPADENHDDPNRPRTSLPPAQPEGRNDSPQPPPYSAITHQSPNPFLAPQEQAAAAHTGAAYRNSAALSAATGASYATAREAASPFADPPEDESPPASPISHTSTLVPIAALHRGDSNRNSVARPSTSGTDGYSIVSSIDDNLADSRVSLHQARVARMSNGPINVVNPLAANPPSPQ